MDPTLRSISLQATDQMRTHTRQWRSSCRQYLATSLMYRLNDQRFTQTTVYNKMTTNHLHILTIVAHVQERLKIVRGWGEWRGAAWQPFTWTACSLHNEMATPSHITSYKVALNCKEQ